jgi:NDP-sugar pyrophosphorylase family protein
MVVYRGLKQEEIEVLERRGCICEDWNKVEVKEGFRPERLRNVVFSGEVRLGVFSRSFPFPGGVKKPSGLYSATIHNSVIHDDVYISHVRNQIANYIICRNVVVESVDSLVTEGFSSFGNGVRVAVLNETGGREVPIYNELSAHTAYLMAFYRHRPDMIEKLATMVDDYTQKAGSNRGTISEGAHLVNCRTILNVCVGPSATLEGIYRLSNGTINSSEADPSYFGPGVIAEDFICASGARVSEGTLVSKCFIGQGCQLGKQYSAENSLFFANSQGFHGEACSVFGGPYTVTHHKSTLLIAGYFSFLNAGSGSNQSNHMYKLGPIHQGVVERGSKTTSDSYLLWPAKIGAFSLVMGRHYRNPDTSDLPFSYLIENRDESYLAPGVNLRSVGTMRDARKWPQRDRRKDTKKLDFILFNLLSPYTVQKMVRGMQLLRKLKETSGFTSDYYMYNNVKMTHESLERGILLYRIGIVKFLGNGLLKRLELSSFFDMQGVRTSLEGTGSIGAGSWVDMAGLFVPLQKVEKLVQSIENGTIPSLDPLNGIYKKWYNQYYEWVWNWSVPVYKEVLDIDLNTITKSGLIRIIREWKEAVLSLDQMMYEDARKEFTLKVRTGFGLDGEDEVRNVDFEQVRGGFEDHPSVGDIRNHMEKKSRLAKTIIDRVKALDDE